MADSDSIVVLVTASSEEEATALGRSLIGQHLAACVNVLPKVQSIFQWEGKTSEEEEYLMVVKTRKSLFQDVEKTILADHSYDVPEIIALPIVAGYQPYMSWIHDMTNEQKSE